MTVFIKNKKQLAGSRARRQVLALIEAGVAAVNPALLIKAAVKFDRRNKILSVKNARHKAAGRIFVIGGGKASGAMAEQLEKIVGPKNITAGAVNCADSQYQTSKIKIVKAGHPIPDRRGLAGVKSMLKLKQQYRVGQNDLIICLISGGGSALMPCPVKAVSLKDKQKLTDILIKSGANIKEINIIRRQLSAIKGGKLAQFFSPAKIISLIISDVVGNDLSVIASGPTYFNSSTAGQAITILKNYKLLNSAPKAIVDYLYSTKASSAVAVKRKLTNSHNYIIGDITLALESVIKQARRQGHKPLLISGRQTGNTGRVAARLAGEVINNKYRPHNLIVLGGETTLRLPKNHGQGGRNQHYAAVFVLAMAEYNKNWTLASCSSDGSDYIKGIAGGIVDENTAGQALKKKINIKEEVARCNSYFLLNQIGGCLIKSAPTRTNVGDLVVCLLS